MAATKTRPGPGARLESAGRPDIWNCAALLAAALVATPLVAVVVIAFSPQDDIWSHLASTVLPLYIEQTLLLMLGVGLGTFTIGTATAWLVTMCRFPGRRLFNWALLLPLAVPAYVLAFVVTDQLEYAGAVQTLLRQTFGWQTARDYWFPEIRSLGGAIAVMTLVLYPYVYLLARAAFLEQSVCVLEVSRTLGRTAWGSFFRVALPLARPAIAIGVALALMETLNDFGTVEFFAVPTFTKGIYDVWLNMSNVSGAAQLSSVLLLFVLALLLIERLGRRGRRYHHTSTRLRNLPSYALRGWRGALAIAACALPVLLGFVLPAGVLAAYAGRHYETTLEQNYLSFVANSLTLSTAAAVVAVAIGFFLAYAVRLSRTAWVKGAARLASIGYAVPGSILAVGVIWPIGLFDQAVAWLGETVFGVNTGALLSGTVAAVVYGYLARFLALSYGTMEASLGKVTPSMDGAARTLGSGPAETLRRVHLPLVRGSLLTAALLVFVDGMKELPMTIILRPFDYDTLATFVFQYASDELLEESALAALTIVAAGIVPVILLSLTIVRSRPGGGDAT